MKGSAALEAIASVQTAIFDKTGTLTQGGAELIEVATAPGRDENEMLRLLASLEQASHHVLAMTIVALARHRSLRLSQPGEIREYRGSGIEGIVDGVRVRAGSQAMIQRGDDLARWARPISSRFAHEPVLKIHLTIDGLLAGIFILGDSLRPDARETLQRLRSAGLSRLVMLTGDDLATASRVAHSLKLDRVVADAAPSDKVATVKAELERAQTMMVGDGINDAPALATATVGIAMGARGATASSQAADAIILSNRLGPVADAFIIAQRTKAIAQQSIVVGLALSGAAMVAASVGAITPVVAALLQEAIDVAVILNALRALGGGSAVVPSSPSARRVFP